ncbi:glycine dehydrogenase [Rubrimonas cliftonensis]|uniref:Glycine dehydrogenase (decarboxylating) n=2 Tax=Rubrimonas cliftonensis TaxID=89524 RepID=A0A1H4FJD3_9RHOB|nr:glycine dehydrogenase [Rubrimonas cliftonensis]
MPTPEYFTARADALGMDAPRAPLSALEDGAAFARRHIGPDAAEIETMLSGLGAHSLAALIDETVPASIRMRRPLNLPEPLTEQQALATLRKMADANVVAQPMIGMGYHGTHTPPVILRNVLENPGWYTAYTPYQAEISQGRLEALLTFQQMTMDLTGFDLANASLLDEATAAAEAMTMARRLSKSKADGFFVDADTHPQTIAVLRTRAEPLGLRVIVGEPGALAPAELFGALLSYPGSSGAVRDWRGAIAALHEAGALAIMATDLLALTLLTPPAALGADAAIGSAQRFGVPMGFGGPHAAFFATREAHKRACPGRIIGVSRDAEGRPALRMALQTREQHIRRDKATSNICTAQALLAVMAACYAVWHGPEGLTRIARRTSRLAAIAAEGLRRAGVTAPTTGFFDTVTVQGVDAAAIADRAEAEGLLLRRVSDDRLAFSFDETTTRAHVEALWRAFGVSADIDALDAGVGDAIPEALRRRAPFLTHPVFHAGRSETQMLRWLRRLQGRDIALDRAMIPLGSCTMKLNATAEMIPITWPGFADIHPFAPAAHTLGYRRLFAGLVSQLREITGFDAVSLQPNAGSQGEYAGLLAIRSWHRSRGAGGRDICLIPGSAHGTNPASAVMAGMTVVLVACDERGDIDLRDLRAKAEAHAERLAALMVTYPSTHGVFEAGIVEVCEIVHAHGGQVYMDGANLNALVGLARPADIGADVCHMNLHKTFCIPHGGGGPGAGPIGVKAHLAPFLPSHPVEAPNAADGAVGGAHGGGAVAAAPWGSALILPISWAYVAMMGAAGLKRATEVAILNANHIARRLSTHFPVVYVGESGRVAHECILDLREIRARTGLGVEDVAKRLVDYGFHAPTMSWPVPETLMIEPTESESLAELDRFCEAMIAIRDEIAAVERGEIAALDSPLRHAPHTEEAIIGERWDRPYPRRLGALPAAADGVDKYWPPVARVDNAAGDRVLVCGCPPPEAYAEAAE